MGKWRHTDINNYTFPSIFSDGTSGLCMDILIYQNSMACTMHKIILNDQNGILLAVDLISCAQIDILLNWN